MKNTNKQTDKKTTTGSQQWMAGTKNTHNTGQKTNTTTQTNKFQTATTAPGTNTPTKLTQGQTTTPNRGTQIKK